MYGHTHSKSIDQPGKVDNPARGQPNRENKYFPVRVRAWEFGLNGVLVKWTLDFEMDSQEVFGDLEANTLE